MVKISPLIASMLLGLAAALPQQGAPSGTGGFGGQMPTGTGVAFPSGTGGFGGHHGGHPSGFPSGFPQSGGPAPTGSFGGFADAHQSGGPHSGGPKPTGGMFFPL